MSARGGLLPSVSVIARDGASMVDAQPAPPVLTDEQLAGRIVTGDPTALSLLYDRYAATIYTMAARLLGSQEAEDVVQEAFLRLWTFAGQYDSRRGAFAPWFMSIARHALMARLRRLSRDRRVTLVGEVDRVLATIADTTIDVEDAVWQQERSDTMLAALAGLPPEQRRVLILAYFGGFTQAAIAEITGAPLGTVKKRVRLGLHKLRHELTGSDLGAEDTERPGSNGQQGAVRNEAGMVDADR